MNFKKDEFYVKKIKMDNIIGRPAYNFKKSFFLYN